MLTVLLLRHAESAWNAEGRMQGHGDPPLTASGRLQIAEAATRCPHPDKIVSSDLQRAHATAEVIAAHFALPVKTDPDLRERDVGDWTGMSYAEIDHYWPEVGGVRPTPPGFEPNDALYRRSLAAVRRHAAESSTLVIVTHAGVIYTIEEELGLSWEPLPNLHGRWLHLDENSVELGSRVGLVDHPHDPIARP